MSTTSPGCFDTAHIPFPESTVLIHGLNPFIQRRAFGFILIGVLAFGFKNQKAAGL